MKKRIIKAFFDNEAPPTYFRCSTALVSILSRFGYLPHQPPGNPLATVTRRLIEFSLPFTNILIVFKQEEGIGNTPG